MTDSKKGYWLTFASALPTRGDFSERPQSGEEAVAFPLELFDRFVSRGDAVGAVSLIAPFDEDWARAIVAAHTLAIEEQTLSETVKRRGSEIDDLRSAMNKTCDADR